ncbi:hypothetical protein [Actinomadura opuntiae]|uniref:hypothetical protein n=1 Tax=Actinomadura sp. OS1-43 TaxID=604315 RepID=UPI00255A733F|nr:hypothetical protein [Actinomadura sp. OS1-43]MDL4818482.1 hypothetical protein [Actinomadura sp. OS1-43]
MNDESFHARRAPSRRSVLRAMAAGAGAAAGSALTGGRASAAPPGQLDVATLRPADLTFSPAAKMAPYSIVSPNLRQLDDHFRRDERRYQMLQPDPDLAAASVRIGDGSLTAGADTAFFTLLRSDTGQRAPYTGVIADVRSLSGSTDHDTVLAGLARDAGDYIMGWYDHASGEAGLDVSANGTVRTFGRVKVKLAPPFRLAFTMTGPGSNVLADEGSGWRVLTGAVTADALDLRGIGPSIANTTFDTAPKVPAGGTLGQLFTVDRPFTGVGGMFPTYQTTDSSVTLSLYRDGPDGALITRRRLTGIPDNAWQFLTADTPLPPGTYYLEQSEPDGPVAWWSSSTDAISWGRAYRNGAPAEGDRTIRVRFPAAETAAELLAAYRNTIGVRADRGTITLGRVEAGYFGQAGIRDPVIVSAPDGAPYIRGGKLYFTLTNSGLAGGIPAAHMGVFRMDLADYRNLEEVGKIFVARDQEVLGDHAGRVIHDPAEGSRVMAVTFGDYDIFNEGVTGYAAARSDVLHGVHIVPSRPVARGIDPYPVRIDGTWWLAVSDGGRTTAYRFTDDAFAEPVPVGANDNGGVYYEGTKVCRIGTRWYILTSSGTDYRVYGLDTRLVGTLDAPHPSGWIPHPMVLPVPLPGNRTRFIQLSMDGDGDPVSGLFGHFLVNVSDQIVRGREYPAR